MFPFGQTYRLADDFSEEQLLDLLADLGDWRMEEPFSETLTFYDSFDWRMYNAGSLLYHESTDSESRVVWRRLDSGATLLEQPGEIFRFAAELPPGPQQRQLAECLEMRCLLPLATLQRNRRPLLLVDRQQKIVLRIFLDRPRLTLPGRPDTRELPRLVSVEPLKGYPGPARELVRLLEQQQPGWESVDLLALILANLQRQPGSPETRSSALSLEPGQPAGEVLQRILSQQHRALQTNQDGILRDLDSEFLHDFRVAVRRARSALGQLKQCLPAPLEQRLRREFAWLGQVTGPVRDLDVYLLHFPDYQASLPGEAGNDLVPLEDFLRRQRQHEQRQLVRRLTSKRYHRLLELVQDWLTDPADRWGEAASLPVIQLANPRIRKTFLRLKKQGRAITDDSPSADLHNLRKTAKRLRYLLEFFQSLYPEKPLRKLIKALKGLQDNLGSYQDLSVQAETLRQLAGQMTEQGAAPPETLLAMGMLIDQLHHREHQCRSEFAERFACFASPSNRQLFAELFTPEES